MIEVLARIFLVLYFLLALSAFIGGLVCIAVLVL